MAENPRIEELRRRVQLDPASIAFAALAEEFRRMGRHEEAIETCRAGLQRHPAYLSARVTLGRALIETGEYESAREELETVLRSAPENLAAIRGLAQIHERQGHSTEMDPHLAAMMNAEVERISLAAAARPAPPPEPVVEAAADVLVEAAPEALVETAAEAGEAELVVETAAEAGEAELVVETAAEAGEAELAVEAAADVLVEAAPELVVETAAEVDEADLAVVETAPEVDEAELVVEAAPEVFTETAPEAIFESEPEPAIFQETEPDPIVFAEPIEAGPDPAMVARLARLQQFLAAIDAARHA